MFTAMGRILPLAILLVGCSDSAGVHGTVDACASADGPEVLCTYPDGPYSAVIVGDTVGPAYWPCSIKASGETYPLDQASLEVFHCDSAVQSVIIFYAAIGDEDCPDRIREVTELKDQLELYGAVVVWMLVAVEGSELPTPETARSYFEEQGVTFGWYTDDEDNTWQAYGFHNHVPGAGVPSMWIIDAETMQIVYNDPMNLRAIVQNLGTD